MRPANLIVTLAVGLPLAAATAGCERERVVPAQKPVEVQERDTDVDVQTHPDTRTAPPAGHVHERVEIDDAVENAARNTADEVEETADEVEDAIDDIDVEGDVDTNADDDRVDIKAKAGVKTDDDGY